MWDYDEFGNSFFIDELGQVFSAKELGFDPDPDYEGAGFVADIAKEYPNFANMTNEEMDQALGQAYQAAGLKIPDDKKAGFLDMAKKALSAPAGLAAAGTALYGLLGGGNQPQTAGYKGKIPELAAVREQIKQPDYVPYSGKAVMGRQFFTPTEYVDPDDASKTREAAKVKAEGITQIAAPDAATAPNPNVTKPVKADAKTAPTATGILKDFLNQSNSGYYDERVGKILAEAPEKTTADVLKDMQRVAAANPNNPLLKFLPPEIRPDEQQAAGSGDVPPAFKDIPAIGIPGRDFGVAQPLPQKPEYSGPKIDFRMQPAIPPEYEERSLIDPQEFTGKPEYSDTYELPMLGAPAVGTSNRIAGAAQGGLMGLASGKYLRGGTDGMADKIPSSIDGVQPAALSHGEFVIPADVVSHLGNGNSDAGANQLYKMMDRVRKDRTGTTKQGKKINPDKYLGGGIANYASGGIAKFQTGGASTVNAGASSITPTNPFGSTTETTLAPYVGDYATKMLGRAQALAGEKYQGYQGPLTAGTSPLQTQAFTSAGNINPQATFSTADLQAYMNPYTQLALQPQLDELRRQAEISQANLQGQFAKAGAFGGGREAIARSEGMRNLQTGQAGIIGKGFENAFTQAMNQYNIGRQQQLADVNALAGLGAQERAIEQEGITALQKQFEQEKMDPYNKLLFQQSMLQGLPVGTTTTTPNLSELGKTGLTLDQATKIYDILSKIPGFSDSIPK